MVAVFAKFLSYNLYFFNKYFISDVVYMVNKLKIENTKFQISTKL